MFQAKESVEVRLSVQAGGPRCEPKVSDEPEKQSSWECKLALRGPRAAGERVAAGPKARHLWAARP